MFKEIPACKKSIGNRKPILGVGVNDAKYTVNININGKRYRCPFYSRWIDVMKRSLSENTKRRHPTYINCSVCDEWLTFSNFKRWMERQDWEGKHLDKDILVPGNKVYSPDTCIFVTKDINTLLTDHAAARGDFPQGVTFDKKWGKFTARCCVYGKYTLLGAYDTSQEASKVYRKFKADLIREIADKQEVRLKDGLYRHAELLMIE